MMEKIDRRIKKAALMGAKKPLWQDIQVFTRQKFRIASALLLIGLAGLVLPVIPGLLLIAIALFILKPEWSHKLSKKIRVKR